MPTLRRRELCFPKDSAEWCHFKQTKWSMRNISETGRTIISSERMSSDILQSLDSMLGLYRDRCQSQSRQISDLKERVEILKHQNDRHHLPCECKFRYREDSKKYVDAITRELEKVHSDKEQLRQRLASAEKRLRTETEWREAAMSWMQAQMKIYVCLHSFSMMSRHEHIPTVASITHSCIWYYADIYSPGHLCQKDSTQKWKQECHGRRNTSSNTERYNFRFQKKRKLCKKRCTKSIIRWKNVASSHSFSWALSLLKLYSIHDLN